MKATRPGRIYTNAESAWENGLWVVPSELPAGHRPTTAVVTEAMRRWLAMGREITKAGMRSRMTQYEKREIIVSVGVLINGRGGPSKVWLFEPTVAALTVDHKEEHPQ